MAQQAIAERHKKKLFGQLTYEECVERYIQSVNNGLLKIMSKMGISVVSSYRGGCNFEAIGLSRNLMSEYFPSMSSKIWIIFCLTWRIINKIIITTNTIPIINKIHCFFTCLLYTSPSPRDPKTSRMPSSA